MSVKTVPTYLLLCDADGCGYGSNEGGEYIAWIDVQNASDEATESGWVITDDGRHYCQAHAVHVCAACGAYDAAPYSGERGYLCRPCAAKDDDAA